MEKTILNKESETLFIPLYGKAVISKAGQILSDKKAEEIVGRVDYDFTKVKMAKDLQIYMGIRAAVIDDYTNKFLQENPKAMVLHLGCGLDSRIERIIKKPDMWYDLDFPDVIAVRRQFYRESECYRMISSSVMDLEWLNHIDSDDLPVLIIAEGLTMYLQEEEMRELFLAFKDKFNRSYFIFDAYSISSVKMSKYSNPVNKLGATIHWGLDDPHEVEKYADGISHIATMYFTDDKRLVQVSGFYRFIFKLINAIKWTRNLYRIYVFEINKK